jgi:hypothetical protein
MTSTGIPENDAEAPKIVWAKAPEGNGFIRLASSAKTMMTLLESRRLASLGEFAGLIRNSQVLVSPTAIFQGLLRPFFDEGVDDTIYAYVSRSQVSFTYRDEKRLTSQQLRAIPAPRESVFVAFVSTAADVIEEAKTDLHPESPEIQGAVLYWEWTQASEATPDWPVDSPLRYRRKVWPV